MWETRYLHELQGEDPVLEWMQGSALRPVMNGLDAQEREVFFAEYRQRLRDAYPVAETDVTLYPFHRLFIVAYMGERIHDRAL